MTKRPARRASQPPPPVVDDVPSIGTADAADDGPVALRKLPDGRAVLLPTGGLRQRRRLGFDGLDVLADVQLVVRRMQRDRDHLDALVGQAREVGVPWALVGFSVGISAQGARQRWGAGSADDDLEQ